MSKTWHAIAVVIGEEDNISDELSGVETYTPTYTTDAPSRAGRRAREVIQEQFLALPGYILVKVENPFDWSAVLKVVGVYDVLRFGGSESPHIIEDAQIDLLKHAEALNFGYPVSMAESDKLFIGEQVAAIIGLVERKGQVVSISGRRAKVEFEGVDSFGPVDIAQKDLRRA